MPITIPFNQFFQIAGQELCIISICTSQLHKISYNFSGNCQAKIIEWAKSLTLLCNSFLGLLAEAAGIPLMNFRLLISCFHCASHISFPFTNQLLMNIELDQERVHQKKLSFISLLLKQMLSIKAHKMWQVKKSPVFHGTLVLIKK